MAIFKITKQNFDAVAVHVRATLDQLGPCWLHGDGNIYLANEEGIRSSETRKEFSNERQSEATYRVKFNNSSELPGTVEELHALLEKSKRAEELKARGEAGPKEPTQTVSIPKPQANQPVKAQTPSAAVKQDAPAKSLLELKAAADDAELQRLLLEEEAQKSKTS
jgi:hypothetical protein